MTYTLDDRQDGSVFDVNVTGGTPTVGSLIVVEALDGTDRRIYKVISAAGTELVVERQSISIAVLA